MPRILYVQYFNPGAYPPLEHSSRMLAEAGWEVLFLGIGSLGADALTFPPHERITVRQMAFVGAGWRQKWHYLRFVLWVCWHAARWRPDWVYASDLLVCPAAWLLGWAWRVVYHEHDSPAANGGSFFVRLCLAARRSVARRARLCVLPNQRRLENFRVETGTENELLCVWNCPRRKEIAPARALPAGDVWALYHGSIVPARLPKGVLAALAALPANVKLRVVGYETVGHLGYVEELKELAARLGIGARVDFVGAVPLRSDLLRICRECDIGLAFMPAGSADLNMQAMTGASNKPFDYLSGGLALLVSDLPDWREMFVAPGYALACDPSDAASIAQALRRLAESPSEMRAMGERGRRQIAAAWNYETQFAPVLARLTENG